MWGSNSEGFYQKFRRPRNENKYNLSKQRKKYFTSNVGAVVAGVNSAWNDLYLDTFVWNENICTARNENFANLIYFCWNWWLCRWCELSRTINNLVKEVYKFPLVFDA